LVIDGFEGEIAIEVKFTPETVRVVDALREPEVAVIVAAPADKVEIRPVPLTEAMAAGEMLQTALPVRSCRLPSLKVPVTPSC
jgi:hypothetical protein